MHFQKNLKSLILLFIALLIVAFLGFLSFMISGNKTVNRADGLVYYESGVLSRTDNFENRILLFNARWCASCGQLVDNLEKSSNEIPEDYKIIIVDIDRNAFLANQYRVSSQHTLVQIDNQGQEIKKWFGSETLQDIILEVEKN